MCVLRCFSLVSKVGKTIYVISLCYREEQRKGDTMAAGRCKKTMLGVGCTCVRVR